MDLDPPGIQALFAPFGVDSHGRKLLPGTWEYASNLGNYPECVWDSEGPGDFLFRPRFTRAIDMIRVKYKFESGTQAQLIENDGARKVYELYAPGGEIDLPTFSEDNTWTWRLPADTQVSSDLVAWHWDLVELEKDRPKYTREEMPAILAELAEEQELHRERLREAHRAKHFHRKMSEEEFNTWLDLHHPKIETTPEECEKEYQALKAYFGMPADWD